ncbi:UDP-3-O-(3-hydroxymyristoyl)glucosamine N-acyltransferase [Desulfurivibrio alkaliphilus]|uniref:UDP-3-O-acylglucosamine N-acyltransferase n=1 Tax=Desulfurivibrio alkaliphilus (strain DSM 19089 / UNIQEM U267 / AHT2) TaxID=589865 RepID=D6Z1Z0_DESAT|nr:UDP-3-O-(3-hydroxymyristoyl)glucosamine N-acyltransferase [Desulfurivibrio alkaliphilus]ADH85565.1 UDP-3-O-(3-hydroxymyristoyl) glucosamine N-acyltransferase [Desulfurivibrio alkaliphilus AHT 2]
MATIKELAAMVDGILAGDGDVMVTGLNDLERAGPQEVTFLADHKLADKLARCRAGALIISPPLAEQCTIPAGMALIKVSNPYLAATRIQNFLLATPFAPTGVHPGALIGEDCSIPEEVSIAAGAVLGHRVRLGRRVKLEAGVVVGDDSVIGDDVVLHANVTVYPRSVLGNRVIVHSGSVLGSDGFGYATDRQGNHHKRAHLGIVRIEDDVEIGANCCVDRGTFGETLIKSGAKIDNLVQIGHNVVVGENTLIVAQAGIAGSTVLDRQVVLGGQVALNGHLRIGAGVMVAAKSGVHNDQEPGAVVSGMPAIEHKKWLRASIAFGKLPDLVREVRELRRQVATLSADNQANNNSGKESGDE